MAMAKMNWWRVSKEPRYRKLGQGPIDYRPRPDCERCGRRFKEMTDYRLCARCRIQDEMRVEAWEQSAERRGELEREARERIGEGAECAPHMVKGCPVCYVEEAMRQP